MLTRRETTILRGLAIGLIIMHNFCHWLPGSVAENEYKWSGAHISQYIDYIVSGGPHLILNFFSHFGHYGVALFLFLSGYGLVKKYESSQLSALNSKPSALSPKPSALNFLPFILHQALKLWQLMIPVLLALWLKKYVVYSGWRWDWSDVVGLLTFTANLGQKHEVLMGPWWWFGLMMQFYVVYYLLLHHTGKRMLVGATALCLGVQLVATYLNLDHLSQSGNFCHHLHYNFPCSILPFSLGIWAARYGAQWLLSPWAALVGSVVVVAGSFSPWAWAVAGPFAVAVMLQGRKLPLHWLGSISAWVFAVHPIMRESTIGWARHGDVYIPLIGYITLTLITAAFTHYALKWINSKL